MSDMNWDKILKEQEAGDSEYGALPADTYRVRVKEASATKSSNGNPMVKITFSVVGGPYDGRLVFTQIVFSENPNAMRFTLRKLNALGITKEILATQNPSLEQIAKMIVLNECNAEVALGTYNDEPSNDVKTLKPIAGGAVPTASTGPKLPGGGPSGPKPGVPTVPKPAPAPAPAPEADSTPEAQVDPPEADAEAPADQEEPF